MRAALSNASPDASSRVCPSSFVVAVAAHQHQVRVRAGGDEHDQREAGLDGRVALFEPRGVGVPLEVVDAYEGQAFGVGDGLGRVHAHHQRPGESRPMGYAHRVEVVERDVRVRQRPLDDGDDLEQVLAGGDLRHDAAVAGVDVYLRGDGVGEDARAVGHDGRRRLVAGGLDAEDEHSRGAGSAEAACRRPTLGA